MVMEKNKDVEVNDCTSFKRLFLNKYRYRMKKFKINFLK